VIGQGSTPRVILGSCTIWFQQSNHSNKSCLNLISLKTLLLEVHTHTIYIYILYTDRVCQALPTLHMNIFKLEQGLNIYRFTENDRYGPLYIHLCVWMCLHMRYIHSTMLKLSRCCQLTLRMPVRAHVFFAWVSYLYHNADYTLYIYIYIYYIICYSFY